ncbi:WS/DGAT/MGAT family O-acyltransferase [Ilumatobacter nonamiensis]|uniref:WS/DGAT/MGAT family O-acyltransferase n=1 Tax=Ilumatobacter nonamiensis TaxID=467093 RepID=UPI000345896D|nr:wax ester/triacylglycerol synthase family O-acyltransferase [Ilumatobacter nonamiensis]
MEQLSGQDASFIYSERGHAPTHITSIGIYDQSTAPDGLVTFKGILGEIEPRLHLARAFRQKVARVPSDLDHPWWVEDANFDLEYHVRHIALPKPGDWRQFCIQVARIHARPLDLSRPLWEMYVIEGLDAIDGVPVGAFGLVTKIHHAAVDGMSGVEMITAIHTQTPELEIPDPPDVPWQPDDDPSTIDLLGRAGVNALTVPRRGLRLATKMVPGAARAVRVQQRQREAAPLATAPASRFNGPVSPHRVIDACFFEFADLKPMRALVPGATVNDVALSVLGGGLRQYLLDAAELPDTPLRAMTPVSVRADTEKEALGNQVSAMLVSLATDLDDPVERLAAVHASTTASKEMTEAIGARNLTELSQFAPGALIGLGTRLAGQFSRTGTATAVNTVVTNVPGPRQPLYFVGAELVRSFGAGPVVDGMGIINIVGTYIDQFVLSFTADREMMPDPAHYASCINDSFHALQAAT